MSLLEKIQTDIIAAMKAKQADRLGAIRLIKAALKKQEVDGRKALEEADELRILASLVKQRKDSIEMFTSAGRNELARRERTELAIIESYMPARASEEELRAAVEAAFAETGAGSMKQMGLVMKSAREKLAGKTVDGKALSDLVRGRLPG